MTIKSHKRVWRRKQLCFSPLFFVLYCLELPEGSFLAIQNILLHKALFKDTGKDCAFADGKGLKEVQYKNARNSQSYMI